MLIKSIEWVVRRTVFAHSLPPSLIHSIWKFSIVYWCWDGPPCLDSIPGAGHLFRYVTITSHPRPTQPSIPPGSVKEYQLRLEGKGSMVHSVSGWTRGVQVKLRSLENACHTWAPFRGVITTRRYTNSRLPLPDVLFAKFMCLRHQMYVAN